MSCKPGELCYEGVKRRRALAALGLMAIIFLALSAVSFLDSRGQAVPSKVTYAGFDAVQGKRAFQSFNCMGCHHHRQRRLFRSGPDQALRRGRSGLAGSVPAVGGRLADERRGEAATPGQGYRRRSRCRNDRGLSGKISGRRRTHQPTWRQIHAHAEPAVQP